MSVAIYSGFALNESEFDDDQSLSDSLDNSLFDDSVNDYEDLDLLDQSINTIINESIGTVNQSFDQTIEQSAEDYSELSKPALISLLQSKQSDLKLAASIGDALFDRNETLESQLQELQSKLAELQSNQSVNDQSDRSLNQSFLAYSTHSLSPNKLTAHEQSYLHSIQPNSETRIRVSTTSIASTHIDVESPCTTDSDEASTDEFSLSQSVLPSHDQSSNQIINQLTLDVSRARSALDRANQRYLAREQLHAATIRSLTQSNRAIKRRAASLNQSSQQAIHQLTAQLNEQQIVIAQQSDAISELRTECAMKQQRDQQTIKQLLRREQEYQSNIKRLEEQLDQSINQANGHETKWRNEHKMRLERDQEISQLNDRCSQLRSMVEHRRQLSVASPRMLLSQSINEPAKPSTEQPIVTTKEIAIQTDELPLHKRNSSTPSVFSALVSPLLNADRSLSQTNLESIDPFMLDQPLPQSINPSSTHHQTTNCFSSSGIIAEESIDEALPETNLAERLSPSCLIAEHTVISTTSEQLLSHFTVSQSIAEHTIVPVITAITLLSPDQSAVDAEDLLFNDLSSTTSSILSITQSLGSTASSIDASVDPSPDNDDIVTPNKPSLNQSARVVSASHLLNVTATPFMKQILDKSHINLSASRGKNQLNNSTIVARSLLLSPLRTRNSLKFT